MVIFFFKFKDDQLAIYPLMLKFSSHDTGLVPLRFTAPMFVCYSVYEALKQLSLLLNHSVTWDPYLISHIYPLMFSLSSIISS